MWRKSVLPVLMAVSRRGFFLLCLGGLLFTGADRPAGAAHPTSGGPAFSDPQDLQEMEPGWLETRVPHDRADLTVSLDQHLYPALQPLINEFARSRSIEVAVDKGTCGISAGKLEKKSVDIGGYCCPPGMTDRLPGLTFHTIGITPLALLIHPDNPIDNLTLAEARGIFSGNIRRYSELPAYRQHGGPDWLITPVVRLHCKQRPGHWRLLLDNENMFSYRVNEVGAIADMIGIVATNVTAIGYEVPWMAREYRQQGDVKMLRVNGIDPLDRGALAAGRYPLYRVYNITTWDDGTRTSQLARDLAAYIVKHAGDIDPRHEILPASQLRKAGWRFSADELIGEPR